MKKRILLFGLGLVAAAAYLYLVGTPTPVTAAPPFESETYFYSSSFNEVGYRFVSCNSGIVTQGSVGPNIVRYIGDRCNSGSPVNCIVCYDEDGRANCNAEPWKPLWEPQYPNVPECS